ncbi:hypothetical protein STSP_34700 [Streptomyces jeddahensis]|uniref:Lipoprotein n=2 Tax=Streptomyces jeddahensis TaxID=1716141 RepID=A0A177HQH8_9ACTN|nr:hypothetical protein STSP_34700 [Streptomyces jeddahensis]
MYPKMYADQPRASRIRRRLAVTGCTTVLAAVPLCSSIAPASAQDGIEDLSAQEITDRARDAFMSAQSVRATAASKGTDVGRGDPTAADLTLDRDGNCTGSMQFKDAGGLVIVKRGDRIWLKADDQFWKTQLPGSQGESAAELFRNRYMRGSTNDRLLAELATVCDLKEIQQKAAEESREVEGLRKGQPTTVDGTPTIPVTGTKDGETHTVYVATEGRPYPAMSTKKGDGKDVTATFKDYNKPVPAETPSAEDSVDISKLYEESPSPSPS